MSHLRLELSDAVGCLLRLRAVHVHHRVELAQKQVGPPRRTGRNRRFHSRLVVIVALLPVIAEHMRDPVFAQVVENRFLPAVDAAGLEKALLLRVVEQVDVVERHVIQASSFDMNSPARNRKSTVFHFEYP